MIKHIIFDLDGTLINSAPSILKCLKISLSKNKISPVIPLDYELIGPPLDLTFMRIVGDGDQKIMDDLVETFKVTYDNEGYKLSVLYDGVYEMLSQLNDLNITMHLATNKRIFPTRKILEQFSLEKFFKSVYAIDMHNKKFVDKSSMLEVMLQNEGIQKKDGIYVGDIYADFNAANINKISFAFAEWGYEKPGKYQYPISIKYPNELIAKLFKKI